MEPQAPQPLSAPLSQLRVPGWLWLTAGVVVGLAIAVLWPSRPLTASTSDRNEKFGMCTVWMTDNLEAVFVLDYLTGKLTGACLGKQGNAGFVQSFIRDVGSDFNVKGVKPQYAMSSGLAQIRAAPGVQPAASVIYVAELTSGQVGCYGIPFRLPNAKNPVPITLSKIDSFPFREPAAVD
jgi:hypothetical protein